MLPFSDLSPQRDQAYLCEGMTEELIRALTKVSGLQVFAARSQHSAAYSVEGGLRRDGTRMRITARLTNSRINQFVWSENYDREFADVFFVQEDIARAIAATLQVQLRQEREDLAAPRTTANTIAYRLYLKARYYWNLRTAEGLLQAVHLFIRRLRTIRDMDSLMPGSRIRIPCWATTVLPQPKRK